MSCFISYHSFILIEKKQTPAHSVGVTKKSGGEAVHRTLLTAHCWWLYSVLPGDVIGVGELLNSLKFGVNGSLQLVVSSELAQK